MKTKTPRIAIVSPNRSAYSETFIKAHVDSLPASLVLHSGLKPTKFGDGVHILNPKLLLLEQGLKKLTQRYRPFLLDAAIIRLLKKHKIDIVLAEFGQTAAEMMPICQKANIPMVAHFHGMDASHYATLKTYKSAYDRVFLHAKAVIVVSKAMEQALLTLGCPKNKLVLNTYGPNALFFENQPDYTSKTLLAVGRFVDKKAPYLTLLAFYETLKQYPDARLRMAGDGMLLNVCKNMVTALNMEKSVDFLGVLSPDEVRSEMEKALAFVQHSIIADSGDAEGTPVGILEASAAALPVISTYHAGIPDVILNEETGFLVKEKDVSSMTAAMCRLFANANLAKTLGEAGRKRVGEHFSMERHIDMLRSVLIR